MTVPIFCPLGQKIGEIFSVEIFAISSLSRFAIVPLSTSRGQRFDPAYLHHIKEETLIKPRSKYGTRFLFL
ncbi:MAG: hypothetical protein WC152_04120 [Candidatus Izemoplasmatales bacterium]